MRTILLVFIAFAFTGFNSSAQGFSGDYALTNWILELSPDDGLSNNTGSTDIISVPNQVTIFGSDDPEGEFANNPTTVDFSIITTTSGIWSFDWEYTTDDGTTQPEFDEAQVIVNDIVVEVLPTPGSLGGNFNQTGTYTSAIAVSLGDKITIRVTSTDNFGGAARIRVFNFSAPGGVLPVQLMSFNAKQSGEQVKLDWATASENNSDRFEVERSTNGRDFEVISTVKSAGFSSITQAYSTIDNNPENGNNYYRLRQVDMDGKFVYSMIKTLKWSTMQLVRVYPNPARTNVTVRYTPDRNETTSITLFDGFGRTVQQRNIAAVAGSNMITNWNVEALAPGIYFFRINNNINSPLRFIKQ